MNNSVIKILEKLEKIILVLTTLLVPLVVCSSFPNPFGLPKLLTLVIGVSLVVLIRAVLTIVKGSLTLFPGSFGVAVFLLALAYLASAIFKTPNKMEAFFVPGAATFVIAGTIFYYLAGGLEKKSLKVVVFLSGVIYSVVTLLAFLGVLGKIPQLPAFAKDTYFNLEGSTLITAIFTLTTLPLGIGLIVSEKGLTQKLFYSVSLAVLLLGLAVNIYSLLPGKPQTPRLPGFTTAWAVTAESIKESPLLGIGVGNYLSAFNLYRPISYNSTDLWNLRYSSADNFYFNLLTETGIWGLAAALILLFSIYKVVKENVKEIILKPEIISLLLLLVSSFVFPVSQTLIFVLIVYLVLASQPKEVDLKLSAEVGSKLPAFIVAVPVIIGLIVLYYFGARAVLAESKFQKTLANLSSNQAQNVYQDAQKIINLNPYVDRYHAFYAQVNLALAQNLAQKKDLTDTDKSNITQLIQQAIREGKATVTLNLTRSGNWELLARIYQSLIAFAQGSDQFTIQTYSQAIALDPINPNLRIALGGVYYSLGNYDEAIKAFELAVIAKPDLANAHYNLAAGYREKNEIDKAIEQMKLVLSLVNKDSKDYDLAKTELDNLEKKKPSQEKSGENLTTPPSAQKSTINPPIELPQEATPPAQP
jgi:tetratricopeptide (TPR) repeat protein